MSSPKTKKTRVNKQIRALEVRLIDKDGHQVGVVSIAEALQQATEVSLDLVEISPTASPPVCRIMDNGKYQFEQSKRLATQRKKQRLIQLKEVKFRPVTDVGDYQIKLKKIDAFLSRGDKVKVSVRFRGREMQHRDLGLSLLERVKNDLEDISIEQEPKLEGRQVTMLMIRVRREKNSN